MRSERHGSPFALARMLTASLDQLARVVTAPSAQAGTVAHDPIAGQEDEENCSS